MVDIADLENRLFDAEFLIRIKILTERLNDFLEWVSIEQKINFGFSNQRHRDLVAEGQDYAMTSLSTLTAKMEAVHQTSATEEAMAKARATAKAMEKAQVTVADYHRCADAMIKDLKSTANSMRDEIERLIRAFKEETNETGYVISDTWCRRMSSRLDYLRKRIDTAAKQSKSKKKSLEK